MTSPIASLPRSVSAHEDARAEVIRDLMIWLAQMWPPGQPMDPVRWFDTYAEIYAEQVVRAQLEAAILASSSVAAALEAQGSTKKSDYELDLPAFTSTDALGRPVMGQAYASAAMVGGAVAGAVDAGGSATIALAQAWQMTAVSLAQATQLIVSDNARSVKAASMLSRDVGYIRVLTPPSCPRCVVLAGKFHRNPTADFKRHPGCDCTQIPYDRGAKDLSGFQKLQVDSEKYFENLSPTDQDRWLGKASAEAVRQGADISQIVNARRGMHSTTDRFGQRTLVTTEGTTKKGWAARYLREGYRAKLRKQPGSRYRRMDVHRLMPEEIYRMAGGDRDISMNLLHKNGYYLDASPSLKANVSWYPRDAEVAAAAKRARKKLDARGVKLNLI